VYNYGVLFFDVGNENTITSWYYFGTTGTLLSGHVFYPKRYHTRVPSQNILNICHYMVQVRMFVIGKRLHTLKHHVIIKKVAFSPILLLFVFISSLLLFPSLNFMYPNYAQNIGPFQGTQPNAQGRPLSNTAPFPPSNTFLNLPDNHVRLFE
jgi:hypothetical protein